MSQILSTKNLTTKIPNILFYNPKYTNNFRMIDVKKTRYIGEMIAYPYELKNDKFLYIKRLHIKPQFKRQGYGSKFIDFAKNLSKNLGFNKKLQVTAATLEHDPQTPPHVFYRKQGFGSDDRNALKNIDRHIRNNRQLDYRKTPALNMHYPAEEIKLNFWERCIEKIYDILN